MKQALMLSISVVAVTYAATAAADPPFLKGAYGFTGTETCLYSGSGFSDNFRVPPPPALVTSYAFAVEGIQIFNGDGTGTVNATATVVVVGPLDVPPSLFTPSANSNKYSYSFTYAVKGDEWTINVVPGTFNGTFLTGPRSGPPAQTFTVTNYPTLTGLISEDAKTLTAATLTPVVETITYHPSGEAVPRICTRSRVFIHLPS